MMLIYLPPLFADVVISSTSDTETESNDGVLKNTRLRPPDEEKADIGDRTMETNMDDMWTGRLRALRASHAFNIPSSV